ncbi:MAG: DUF1549 domain-containing protein, partial [Verrucomicrobia bacterium]|nr:DUF1549 domain-containing protein [Verrucomicrobiota bacterium]
MISPVPPGKTPVHSEFVRSGGRPACRRAGASRLADSAWHWEQLLKQPSAPGGEARAFYGRRDARRYAGPLLEAALAALCWLTVNASRSILAAEAPSGAGDQTADLQSASNDTGQGHWAFRPVQRFEPPAVKQTSWVRTAVDRFILARLESEGIAPAPPATKEQFIRRVTFDLIGLPPRIEEIDAFVKDASPDAQARLIEKLLATPHYGERWGRHWLDVARFAETDGFEHDAVRPHAWRYRDYVVESFNQDKPYDRFIKEQLAGDELFPNENAALIATAFNLLGPDMVDSADQIQRRLNRLNDMTDTAGSAFLGLTIGCARCHDHKFEPLSQRDYY